MDIEVNEDRKVYIWDKIGTQNENGVTELKIIVPDSYQNFNKKIVFLTDDKKVWDIIENDTYKLKREITQHKKVQFYIWLTHDDLDFRSQTRTLEFFSNENANEEITEEETNGISTVVKLLDDEIEKVTELENEVKTLVDDIEQKLENGELKGEQGNPGEQGEKGNDATINGINTIVIKAGANISLEQNGDTLIINSIQPNTSNFITKAVEDLINYYTKNESYSKDEIDKMISSIPKFKIEVVESLPATGDSATVYLVKTSEDETNLYTEYIYINGWEELGRQEVDLTGYATEEFVNKSIQSFLTEIQINALISTALESYYNKEEIDNKLSNKLNNDALIDYVRNTDYATDSKAGLVKVNAGYGIELTADKASLRLVSANQSQVAAKKVAMFAITPAVLDYAVKTAITTNSIELTEEEKTNAQNWLGINNLINNIESLQEISQDLSVRVAALEEK